MASDIYLSSIKIRGNSEIKQMEREVNGNVNATTNLNTQAEQDVRVLAMAYLMFKIGEFTL